MLELRPHCDSRQSYSYFLDFPFAAAFAEPFEGLEGLDGFDATLATVLAPAFTVAFPLVFATGLAEAFLETGLLAITFAGFAGAFFFATFFAGAAFLPATFFATGFTGAAFFVTACFAATLAATGALTAAFVGTACLAGLAVAGAFCSTGFAAFVFSALVAADGTVAAPT